MSLIDYAGAGILPSFFKPSHMMDRTTVNVEGLFGPQYKWVEGAALDAMYVKTASPETKVAEAEGLSQQYTVVVKRGVTLRHGDVLKRDEDGATFRITGTTVDWEAPEMSTVQIAKTTAERWDPPA